MMENTPRLSIIVPAYNVEPFLDKCLASICNQTFRDFEVILVNDGSTDGTLSIAQAWASKDARIRLIDQENRGLAAVRNIGLREARTEKIFFVDSDDYLELNTLELMWGMQEESGADVVISNYVLEDLAGVPLPAQHAFPPQGVMTGGQALLLMLYDQSLRSYSCMRIFSRRLFDGISFPEGELLEDFQTIYKVVARAAHVAILPARLYHYVQQGGSILNNSATQLRVYEAWLKAFGERCQYALQSPLLSPKERSLFYIYSVKRLSAVWKIYQKRLREVAPDSTEAAYYRSYIQKSDELVLQLYGRRMTRFLFHWMRIPLFFRRYFS